MWVGSRYYLLGTAKCDINDGANDDDHDDADVNYNDDDDDDDTGDDKIGRCVE